MWYDDETNKEFENLIFMAKIMSYDVKKFRIYNDKHEFIEFNFYKFNNIIKFCLIVDFNKVTSIRIYYYDKQNYFKIECNDKTDFKNKIKEVLNKLH